MYALRSQTRVKRLFKNSSSERFSTLVSIVSDLAFFYSKGWTDGTGYIAVDDTKNLIILSFRGSHDVRNLFADADFL